MLGMQIKKKKITAPFIKLIRRQIHTTLTLCQHRVSIQETSENTRITVAISGLWSSRVLSVSLQVWAFDPVIESLPIVDTNVHFARKQGLERYKWFCLNNLTPHTYRRVLHMHS